MLSSYFWSAMGGCIVKALKTGLESEWLPLSLTRQYDLPDSKPHSSLLFPEPITRIKEPRRNKFRIAWE
jgi:hypothetical protein